VHRRIFECTVSSLRAWYRERNVSTGAHRCNVAGCIA
jgi:hypothetical protein